MSSTPTPRTPQPSSSVLVISPQNSLLLLHRIQRASSFASAHVFPGGNLDPFHDSPIPSPESADRHQDGEAYRLAAVRETFEESGILLARNNGFRRMVEVSEEDRLVGRRGVHAKGVEFRKWLASKGGRADVDALLPFTRWITPPWSNNAKRFTTQMYIYFLPLPGPTSMNVGGDDRSGGASGMSGRNSQNDGEKIESTSDAIVQDAASGEAKIPPPTSDGGLEHTSAQFLHASTWLQMAQRGEIILFPPQYFLLSLIAEHLPSPQSKSQQPSLDELKAQRARLREFVREGHWGEKVICPRWVSNLGKRRVLSLHDPGVEELRRKDVKGEWERVVLANFKKEGPRDVEVRLRADVEKEIGELPLSGEQQRASKI
ncbi:MAG: hypothetical protein Q9162_001654 [Coniocarpon cinnabarinum]